ncbi:MAG: phosphoenolpyruvate synthase, partial [Candidatus Atribacteria bacterium]
MNTYIRTFRDVREADIATVGGKAANLIALKGIEGIRVPDGFCVTTDAYEQMFSDNDRLCALVNELGTIESPDTRKVERICDQIQGEIRSARIPTEIAAAVKDTLSQFDEGVPWAVRSSATAEDLPTASFAGQHDTYLNVLGTDSVLEHISRCWASLFTPRAVTYRMRNGFAHRQVHLAVVVQRLAIPEVAGIMFTADPLTSDRKVVSIDAGYGLGEAFVSGRAKVDTYRVKDGVVIGKTISTKESALRPSADGGTHDQEIEADSRNAQALTDDQVLRLARLGRKIEEVFGHPQDIEWCLQDNEFFVVQSRPITTLYPLAPGNGEGPRVYISGGHLQMMTDPMKPLGIFFFAAVSGEACSHSVGGRLYLDITHDLASPIGRKLCLSVLKMVGDRLMYDGLRQLAERRGFFKSLPRGKDKVFALKFEGGAMGVLRHGFKAYRKNDPETVKVLIRRNEEMVEKLRAEIASLSGTELLDFIAQDQRHLRANVAFAEAAGALTAGLLTAKLFDKKTEKWLGEKGASDTIIQSVPNSITTDTGYALLDVADTVRQHPAVMDYLQTATNETFFEGLQTVDGGDVVS